MESLHKSSSHPSSEEMMDKGESSDENYSPEDMNDSAMKEKENSMDGAKLSSKQSECGPEVS